ncbi:hypothetical protein [Alkaliphilus sp. B6464]|nr:hypothetical protein [Alkaliphilus sp. B6464]QUH21456.1 hypothetical protein HYG84_17240 [Alkaliphilus sp. B6464]
MTDRQLQEIKADVNNGVSRLFNYINLLEQENSYLKRQIRILKGEHEDE